MATKVFLQQLILDPDRLKCLVEEAKEMAFQHGIMSCTHETPNSSEVVTYAPFTLFPSPVPKAALLQALAVQTHFNTLVDKISQDPDFLEEALAGYKGNVGGCIRLKVLIRLENSRVTATCLLSNGRTHKVVTCTLQADDFTLKLFGIYRQVQQEGRTQSIVMGLNRCDYMVDQREDVTSSLKQIEINTIAAGGFAVCARLPLVHRHILRSAGLFEESKCVPDINKTSGMSTALAKAWELYGQQKAVIMFLVEDVQIAKLNHRYIEKELWNRNIPVIRRKFGEVSRGGSLDGDKKLFIDGLEVAVVYYRYGYMPGNYTDQAWDARLLMERSLAVKCPDISTHLAGTKKVQQVLSRPGVLEKFFPDQPQVVEQIRATFTGLYTLDMGPEGDRSVAMALADPVKFVLKPQREGGGNNYYGEDIVRVLQEVKSDQRRAAYILMDKILPGTTPNIMVRRGLPLKLTSVCNEIGVYGAYVRHEGQMVLNEAIGHILKTKDIEQNDSGVINAGVYRRISVSDSALVI